MDKLWGAIDPLRWRETPVVVGRSATEDDVRKGIAVFYVPGRSEPAEMQLPRAAIQRLEDGSTQRVVVVQAERGPSGIILGVRPLTGGNGICMEDEVQFVLGF